VALSLYPLDQVLAKAEAAAKEAKKGPVSGRKPSSPLEYRR